MLLSRVNNESGMTLTELIIALGLSALLLILVVSGSLFVKKYIADWSDRDKVTEELAFVAQEILPKLESSQQIEVFDDSLLCHQTDGHTVRYNLVEGTLRRNDHSLTRVGLQVDLLDIHTIVLPNDTLIVTLQSANVRAGLYSLTVAVSDQRGNADTLTTVGRNRYESLKYNPE